VDGGSGFFSKIFGWLPGWVGLGFALLVGAAAIVFGIINGSAGLIAFGAAAIISVILALISGARATPRIDPFSKSFGAVIEGLDGITSAIIIALFIIAIVIALVVR
jgi:hypothetical protein